VTPVSASGAGVTVSDAAAACPVLAVAVIATVPAEMAVTRHPEPCTALVATTALLLAQLASVGGAVRLPPLSCTAKVKPSPTFTEVLGGEMPMTTGSAGGSLRMPSPPPPHPDSAAIASAPIAATRHETVRVFRTVRAWPSRLTHVHKWCWLMGATLQGSGA